MSTVTVKSSTIFIATGDRIQVFRSLEEVPAALRKKLLESTTGLNSATILIADRRGREEIARALRGESTSVPASSSSGARFIRRPRLLASRAWRLATSWRLWVPVVAAAAAGAGAWLVANLHH
jgi:hypothetical protein